jgi:hypothetical protein
VLPSQQPSGTHEHRYMGVMAARVHHARNARAVFGAAGLLDGQRVHVSAEGYHRLACAQFGDDAGPADTAAHPEPERLDGAGRRGCGAELAERQLRVAVQVPAQCHEVALERRCLLQ